MEKITFLEYVQRVSPIPLSSYQVDLVEKLGEIYESGDTATTLCVSGMRSGKRLLLDLIKSWEELYMNTEEQAIKCLFVEAGKAVGTPSYGNETAIAAEIATKICEGKLHTVMIPNCSREHRKRIIGIAFNMVGDKPLICKIFGNKDGKCCEACSRVCCHNKVLQRRFAEEMFPGFKIY